jgi:hypothetical protein
LAFRVLSSRREWGAGLAGLFPQPIRYSEISRYGEDHGFDEDFDEFLALVMSQDEVFTNHQSKLRSDAAAKTNAKRKK